MLAFHLPEYSKVELYLKETILSTQILEGLRVLNSGVFIFKYW